MLDDDGIEALNVEDRLKSIVQIDAGDPIPISAFKKRGKPMVFEKQTCPLIETLAVLLLVFSMSISEHELPEYIIFLTNLSDAGPERLLLTPYWDERPDITL